MVGKTKLVSRLCLIAIYNTFSNRWIIKKMCWTIFIYLYASPLYLYFKFGNDEWDPYKFALLYIMRKLNFQLSYVLKLNRQNRRNKKVRFSWHLVPLISTSFSQLIAADVRYFNICDLLEGNCRDSIAQPFMSSHSCQDTETTRPSHIVWFQL